VWLERVQCKGAPAPLGNYSHAIVAGDWVYVSGMAARDPVTDQVPGLRVEHGRKISYDIRAETKATLENVRKILETAGSDLSHVVDVTVYLTDMADFGAYNEIYAEYFAVHRPARTTLGVASLPGNISIEMKVTAVRKEQPR